MKQAVWIMLAILVMGFNSRQEKIVIFSIGDSTMADYPPSYLNQFGNGYPIRGWMQMAPSLFNEQVEIRNYARSGRSSKSFRTEGLWEKVIQQVRPGDYVFIQFGHNDAKPDTARHTEPETDFRQNLLEYIREVTQKQAHPILFTSIARRKFDENGHLVDTHGGYVSVVRQLAAETGTPLIDLNQMTTRLLEETGPEASKALFLHIPPGKFASLPEGKKDDTHLSVLGATTVAELAVQGLIEQGLPLENFIHKPTTTGSQ